jgi:hypothetical protein
LPVGRRRYAGGAEEVEVERLYQVNLTRNELMYLTSCLNVQVLGNAAVLGDEEARANLGEVLELAGFWSTVVDFKPLVKKFAMLAAAAFQEEEGSNGGAPEKHASGGDDAGGPGGVP